MTTTYQVPKYITKKLMAAFQNTTSRPGEFPVHDTDTNDYLIDLLPVSCGWERETFNIDNAFTVWFDFRIGRFYVSGE